MALFRKEIGASDSSSDTPSIPISTQLQPDLHQKPLRTSTDIFNIVFYVAVFTCIGLPLWWVATTTSRASLPFDRIDAYEGNSPRKIYDSSESNSGNYPLIDPSQKWKAFWILPPTTAVDIVITLVNPTPGKMNVKWNVAEGFRKYFDPTLAKLSGIANFKISSQILRYIDGELSGITTKSLRNQIPLLEASKIINFVESRLGSFSSNNHVLNFIVYVPSPDQQPLDILDQNGQVIPTNSFITPRWGGAMVYSGNHNFSASEIPTIEVDMKYLAEVFLAQLFTHLGIIDADAREPNLDFEKDFEQLILKRSRMNIEDSILTLKSLSSLLGQMGQIAINDLVAQNVYDAVRHIDEAKFSLGSSNNLQALIDSRKAWENSERAFYDPSLLEQLYFPDDQKFAIYVPLFLPVGIPVVMSIREAIKWLKARRTNLQAS